MSACSRSTDGSCPVAPASASAPAVCAAFWSAASLVGGNGGRRTRKHGGLLAEAVQRHCVDVMTNGSESLYRDKIVEYLRAGMELEEAFNAARIGSEITSAAIASYTRAPVGSHVPDDLEISFTTWRRDIWPKMGKHA